MENRCHTLRRRVRDLAKFQVRNNLGQMIRLGTIMSVRDTSDPVSLLRYNMYSAVAITGNTRPGTSSGQAVDLPPQTLAPERQPLHPHEHQTSIQVRPEGA